MIKAMLKPFFKKFIGLFISMVFVSMLSVGLLSCFGSCMINVKKEYQNFVAEYQDMDEQITTGFHSRNNLVEIVKSVDGVKEVDARLAIDCYLYKENEDRTIVSRVFTYNETTNTLLKRYVLKSIEPNKEMVNIGVSEKFAKNNKFELGQTIKLGFLEMYQEFYINEIVNTPEAIYPRANNYIWSDNYDFGYLYASEAELSLGLNRLAKKVLDKVQENEEFKRIYEEFIATTGITIPDMTLIDETFASKFANQLIVKNQDGTTYENVLNGCLKALEDEHIKVKSSAIKPYFPHIAYMDHALEQVQVASIFLPVFFYSVTMIVVGLFINQIIKTMTPQIGVFMSIGIDNWDTIKLFLIFTIIMALVSGLIGAPVGFLLNLFMSSVMRQTYSIPTVSASLHPLVVVGAILGLLIFVIATTLVATKAIFKITPKDATISNESKRKKLPKPLQRFIDKAPMNIKLGTNSIAQNPRRFFVSSFSIFASLILILLSTLFFASKEEMIDQSVNRRLAYDCQVYLTQKEDDAFINNFANQTFVSEFENCYYTYLKADKPNGEFVYLECLAVDEGINKLVTIPNIKGIGNLSVPEEGIVLTSAGAKQLGVKKGDKISINGKDVVVTDISFQYVHPICYLSRGQMEALEVDYVSSFILNVNDEGAFLTYLSTNRNQCLTVFTKSLSKDLHNIFDSVNAMIYIMVGFSLGMAFIILSIMSQNALMEQQRQLTIFRAIGFTILDISNVWTLQSVAQLVLSSLIGVPAGALAIFILLRLCSSASQTYPFVMSLPIVLLAISFILLVVVACHLIAMRSISKWNIADNTRSRE